MCVKKEVMICGGHHRVAVARAKDEKNIPLLVQPLDLTNLGKIIPLQMDRKKDQ